MTAPGQKRTPGAKNPQGKTLDPERRLTAEEVYNIHRNADTDKTTKSIHHTLGGGRFQATPGDHTHDGGSSTQLWTGRTVTGSRGSGAAITSLLLILADQGIIDGTSA